MLFLGIPVDPADPGIVSQFSKTFHALQSSHFLLLIHYH
jgi:hypothetical protein